ncbi:Dienelactone hydrolase family [Teratosphaeria destructans]|uniref:Dienelactone hydrolase family n=1 Tax=Teratosphaeria destructans TaxID=418781 RepID=A0A9W7W1U4_9PEZI|nr:Dienelactone hydrolase family [Teratosphaeria destructans]
MPIRLNTEFVRPATMAEQTNQLGYTGEVASGTRSDNPVIAKPSGDCCLQGTLHEGNPRGTKTTVAGVETYVVEPRKETANGHILLYFPDVYGFFINGFLIMDAFADAGYHVLGLDYFRGDPITKYNRQSPDFDFDHWLKEKMAFSDPAVPKWIDEVKSKYGGPGTKFACVGYCYGAPYVCDQLAAGGSCTAGAFAHPAFLKESHFYNLQKPLFLSCSEIDHTFPNEFRNRAVDIMQAEQKRFQVQLFQGVAHGFALRGNPEVPYERYTKEQSVRAIVAWFDFWLSQ